MARRGRIAGTIAAVLVAGALLVGQATVAQASDGQAQTAPPAPPPGQLLDPPSPPGSNDWTCRPSAEHPNPVVLVHGLLANQSSNWAYIAPELARSGYCVFSLTYGRQPLGPPTVGGLAPMERSAAELAAFVDRVRAATGADKVDLVGHSEGSLMPTHYVRFLGGADVVDRYVGMTPLWDGTRVGRLDLLDRTGRDLGLDPVLRLALDPLCASCRQFLPGSEFLERINSDGGPAVEGITYTMILTRFDAIVVPFTSGLLDGATNIVLQDGCPGRPVGHIGVAFDPVTLGHIRNALDPANARPVPCTPRGPQAPVGG